MTAERARELVAQLAAAWPWPQMPDATIAIYPKALRPLNGDVADEALASLVHGSRRLPSIAEFEEAYRAKARLRIESEPRGELPNDPIPAEAVEWLRARGVPVDGLLKHIEDATTTSARGAPDER
jgi:hypothetical protein